MQAAINCVVTLEFDLFDAESDELIETTQGFDPMQALLGHGDLSPGMEQALLGKSRGDRFEATITPEQGYGTGERLRTQTVSRELFEGMQPKVGTQFQAQTERGIEIVTVTAVEGPSGAAPTPTRPAETVISLFSNAYTNVFVDRWAADFDPATVEDVVIDGSDTKLYTNLGFAVVELFNREAGVDQHEVTDLHVVDHHQARFTLHAVDFAHGDFVLDCFYFHRYAKTHGATPFKR